MTRDRLAIRLVGSDNRYRDECVGRSWRDRVEQRRDSTAAATVATGAAGLAFSKPTHAINARMALAAVGLARIVGLKIFGALGESAGSVKHGS